MGGPLVTLAIIAGLVVVHEIGHVLAGLAIGIPRSAMKIEFGVPISQVILSDDRGPIPGWDHARYGRLVRSPRRDLVFTAGGIVVQTAAVVATVVALAPFDATHRLAERIVWASLLLLLGYLIVDVVLTRRTGHPQGDNSSLWRQSPPAAVASLAAVGATHVQFILRLG